MRPAAPFTPEPAPALALVRRYPPARLDRGLGRAAEELALLFQGRAPGECEQASWMGRGAFRRLGPGRYLVAKGIGPSPRSEALRQALDTTMRAAGRGGCLRLPTGTRYPLLVKVRPTGEAWEAVDPRPEGFSMFRDVARDAEAGLLYLRLGARVLSPLLLLRDREKAPWGGGTPEHLAAYLRERLPAALARDLAGEGFPPPERLRLRGLFYDVLDGGLLIRAARSPFRVADFQTAAAEGDRDGHAALSSHLARRCPDGAPPARAFGDELARTAALLWAHGVVHGQLGLHHQNVSLAAELADFDSTVAVRAADCDLRPVPFPEPPARHALARFSAGLARAESCWEIEIEPGLRSDLRTAGLRGAGLDEGRLAAALLLQAYELYLHAVRVADLLDPRRAADLVRPGTVLDETAIGSLRSGFAAALAAGLARHGALALARWCLDRGLARLLDERLDPGDRLTLHGWTSPHVPVDHTRVAADGARKAHIRAEAEALCAAIASAVARAS